MRLRTSLMAIYLFSLVAIAGVVVADDEPVMEKKSVYVVKTDGMGEVIIDSDVSGIHLDELADGESRSWVTDDGSEVTVTRSEGALIINNGGEDIVLEDIGHLNELAMSYGAGHNGFVWHDGEGMDVQMFDSGFAFGNPGVSITSSEEIPEAAREEISQVLKDYGIESPVRFVQFGNNAWAHGDHHGQFDHDVEVDVDQDGKKHVRVMRIHKDTDD